MVDCTRAEICVVACAEAFRGDGEILASPMGIIPSLGARLARATFSPDLLLTDGIASLLAPESDAGAPVVEGWMPYRAVFDTLWSGRRHVMMGASQIDKFGNQNISCVGPWARPKTQLLGVRGAPGNTINHATSYFVPNHGRRVFVERVDVVSGVGYDRAAELHPKSSRFHQIRCVVTNLAVLDFDTPNHRMRIRSLHPGVSLSQVVESTGFELEIPQAVPTTRLPSATELSLIREVLGPGGIAEKELPS